MNTVFGQKIRMSQAFIDNRRVPVTVIKAGPAVITQIKTAAKDGYEAVQVGFGEQKNKRVNKPTAGHLKKVSTKDSSPAFLGEIKMKVEETMKVGDQKKVSEIFSEGDTVAVTGVSKGKGFAGVVKRWGFAGGPRTHGQSDRLRAPGSIGQGTTPGRVWKGKKMPGRMGADQVTIKNLKIVNIEPEKDEFSVSGPVPGGPKGIVKVRLISRAEAKKE